jgi:hypothetical protein
LILWKYCSDVKGPNYRDYPIIFLVWFVYDWNENMYLLIPTKKQYVLIHGENYFGHPTDSGACPTKWSKYPVAASTTWTPPDKCRQLGGMSQKVWRGVKISFVLVIKPLPLQLCLRLIISYPKKDIKSPSSTVTYAAIYSQNDKN